MGMDRPDMAKASPSRLLLMRSGRTEWDLLGRVQGAADLPMSQAGRETVESQARGLAEAGLDVILTAPDEASRGTGAILAEATQAKKVVAVPDLAEMGLGLWEGLRYEELENRYCRAGRQFLEDPSGVLAPEGEAMDDFSAKVRVAVARALARQRKGTTVGIVVRPIALGLIRCVLNGADLGQLWAMLSDRPDVEWYQVFRNDPRLVAPVRPRRPARAA